jgi:hypothetical protein
VIRHEFSFAFPAALFRRFLFVFLTENEAFGLFATGQAFLNVISTVVVSHKLQYSPFLPWFPSTFAASLKPGLKVVLQSGAWLPHKNFEH